MKLQHTLLTILILLSGVIIRAQGKVVITEHGNIKTLFTNYIAKNKAETSIKGWRIQLISTVDRREMEAIRNKFISMYPDLPNNWKHVNPNYQVRIGAYKTKGELLQFLYTVKKDFPAAIAIQDDINKQDFIKY